MGIGCCMSERRFWIMRYNNYHKHDHISNIFSPDTNTKQIEYIKKCVEYGHTNYFTTNHGSMGDIFEAKILVAMVFCFSPQVHE